MITIIKILALDGYLVLDAWNVTCTKVLVVGKCKHKDIYMTVDN